MIDHYVQIIYLKSFQIHSYIGASRPVLLLFYINADDPMCLKLLDFYYLLIERTSFKCFHCLMCIVIRK